MTDTQDTQPPELNLFCLSVPQLPRAWDSTMLGLLKECPRKFFYTIIQGWQSPGFAAHLVFGIAYHKVLENFDKDIAEGRGYEESLLNAAQFAMNYGEHDEAGYFQPYDSMFTKESHKTRETLLRSTIWYLEHFKHDPLKTYILANGNPAVELSFKINLDLLTPDDEPFVLCGHLDRLVENGGTPEQPDLWYLDRKTTKGQINGRYWNQFNPNNQMSLYHSATQMILTRPAKGGIIDAAEIGVTYTRFKRHTLLRTPGLQQEWLKDTYIWISQAIHYATEQYWPMNDKSCGNYGGCAFQIVCARDPNVRKIFLENEGFIKRKWNPLESR